MILNTAVETLSSLTFDLLLIRTGYRLTTKSSVHVGDISLLRTKRNLLYIRNQSIPRCKHSPPRL